ncbi:hypothetical protein PLESTM_000842400 [Pleodorina starrii]|nr:hypothetical protein PLESTM_000842400 [Pleodorina starrii]
MNLATTLIDSIHEHFCAGQLVLGDGRPVLVGGYNANLVLGDGRRIVTVLVVGGTAELDRGPQLPYAEHFNPDDPDAGTVIVEMPLRFKQNAGNNWFPFINQLPRGEVLWWGNRAGSITTTNWTLVRNLPPLPAEYPFHTMYKYTSAIVLHALQPDANGAYNNFTLHIFGGAPVSLAAVTPASNYTARLDFWYCGDDLKSICDGGWIIEFMGARRVMGDASVLPNGRIMYHGGAQTGRAGLKTGLNNYLAERPAANSIMYDPEAPAGSRFTLTAHIGYAKMYHSAACLDLSGDIFVAGCDMCGPRMIPIVSDAGTSLTLRAPPKDQPAVAPFGYYMLFLLGEHSSTGRTYSEGCWMKLEEAA